MIILCLYELHRGCQTVGSKCNIGAVQRPTACTHTTGDVPNPCSKLDASGLVVEVFVCANVYVGVRSFGCLLIRVSLHLLGWLAVCVYVCVFPRMWRAIFVPYLILADTFLCFSGGGWDSIVTLALCSSHSMPEKETNLKRG